MLHSHHRTLHYASPLPLLLVSVFIYAQHFIYYQSNSTRPSLCPTEMTHGVDTVYYLPHFLSVLNCETASAEGSKGVSSLLYPSKAPTRRQTGEIIAQPATRKVNLNTSLFKISKVNKKIKKIFLK